MIVQSSEHSVTSSEYLASLPAAYLEAKSGGVCGVLAEQPTTRSSLPATHYSR